MEDDRVDNLGAYLGLPGIKTNEVRRNFYSPSQRREAYLDLYVADNPCPSWNQVADALGFGAYLHSQADIVEETYVRGSINHV